MHRNIHSLKKRHLIFKYFTRDRPQFRLRFLKSHKFSFQNTCHLALTLPLKSKAKKRNFKVFENFSYQYMCVIYSSNVTYSNGIIQVQKHSV